MNDGVNFTAQQYEARIAGLIERGRYDFAAKELAQALAAFPDESDLLYQAARLDLQQNSIPSALNTLLQLLARDPEHFGGRFLLVHVYEAAKEHAKAEAILLDLLADYPQAAPLYAQYAMLMYRTLHVEKAKALAREALRLDPDDEHALSACLIGDLIDGRKDAQQSRLAELLHKYPEDRFTGQLLISHLVEQGKYWSAKRIAIELLRAEPNSKEILNLVVEIELLAHWTMVPLWPFNRWGLGATIGFFLIVLFGMSSLVKHLDPASVGVLNVVLISYVVYSWIYPPLLKRWLKRRAGI
jgi:tetratricopeptide (TPR) repeat protein